MAAPVRVGLSAVSGVCDPVPVPLLARCACVRGPSCVCPGSCLSGVAWLCNLRSNHGRRARRTGPWLVA